MKKSRGMFINTGLYATGHVKCLTFGIVDEVHSICGALNIHVWWVPARDMNNQVIFHWNRKIIQRVILRCTIFITWIGYCF